MFWNKMRPKKHGVLKVKKFTFFPTGILYTNASWNLIWMIFRHYKKTYSVYRVISENNFISDIAKWSWPKKEKGRHEPTTKKEDI